MQVERHGQTQRQCNFHSNAPETSCSMLYLAYQTHADIMVPVRAMAQAGLDALAPWASREALKLLRNLTAAYELIARAGLTHARPPYDITSVQVGNRRGGRHRGGGGDRRPSARLLRFQEGRRDRPAAGAGGGAPVGHFATLLRSLVRTMLPEHDVCITDWHNARDASIDAGRFGFDEYVEHLIKFLEKMGPGAHVVAVCQPCVQVLAAAAVMAEAKNPASRAA